MYYESDVRRVVIPRRWGVRVLTAARMTVRLCSLSVHAKANERRQRCGEIRKSAQGARTSGWLRIGYIAAPVRVVGGRVSPVGSDAAKRMSGTYVRNLSACVHGAVFGLHAPGTYIP